MDTRRWTNPSLPQTLQIAVILLYMNAVFGLLLGSFTAYLTVGRWVGPQLTQLVSKGAFVAMAAAGFGIANEKRWGYRLGVGVTVGEVVMLFLLVGSVRGLLSTDSLLTLLFTGARAALLLHPQSRGHQRIWFH